MRWLYCHTQISNKASFCSSCGGINKKVKRMGAVKHSGVFRCVLSYSYLCFEHMGSWWKQHFTRTKLVCTIFLGISISASELRYRFPDPKRYQQMQFLFLIQPKPAKQRHLIIYARGTTSSDSINQPLNHLDNSIESFTHTFSAITSDGEIPELQGDYWRRYSNKWWRYFIWT